MFSYPIICVDKRFDWYAISIKNVDFKFFECVLGSAIGFYMLTFH